MFPDWWFRPLLHSHEHWAVILSTTSTSYLYLPALSCCYLLLNNLQSPLGCNMQYEPAERIFLQVVILHDGFLYWPLSMFPIRCKLLFIASLSFSPFLSPIYLFYHPHLSIFQSALHHTWACKLETRDWPHDIKPLSNLVNGWNLSKTKLMGPIGW